MSTRGVVQTVAAVIVVALCSAIVSARTYSLTVAGERLEFVPQVEKGYVVKLTPYAGGIQALSGVSALDAEHAAPIGGLGRRGVWVVENHGSAERNEETIRSLQAGSRVGYAAPLFSSNGETVAIIPEIVVRVRPGIEMEVVERLGKTAGCTILKRMEFTQQEYLLEVLGPDVESVFVAVEQLNRLPEVEWACPNTALRPKLPTPVPPADRGALPAVSAATGTLRIASAGEEAERTGVFPNDEYFPNQWHLYNTGQSGGTPGADIRAPEAWDITTGDPNIVIAVVDCGIDSQHPDLIENLVPGYDFYEHDDMPDPVPLDRLDAHGTECAGAAAARGNNGIGVTGVAFDCKIMPIRDGSSADYITQPEKATALRWAAVHGADVLSNSWAWTMIPTPILHSAIVDITKPGGIGRGGKGCVVVFAAGNDEGPMKYYPPKYQEVIAVGATDQEDVLWPYSSYGPHMALTAPSGCDGEWCGGVFATLWTTDLTGTHGNSVFNDDPNLLDYAQYWGGTSVSCPIVAGVAALILSIEPDLTNDEVRHFLERSAKDLGDPGRDDYCGWGRVDARAALDMVLAYRCDLNKDWKVDEQDLAILTAAIDANDLSADVAPVKKRDGIVDAKDVALLRRCLGTLIPEMGLIAHWKLDETEGVLAGDSTGWNHHATVTGNSLWRADGGTIGGALELDGKSFTTADLGLDPAGGPFSIFAWVRGGRPGQVIISQDNTGNLLLAGSNWLLTDPATGAMMTELVPPPGRTPNPPLVSDKVITDGDWHRIGFTWDGVTRALYVDDALVAKDAQSNLASCSGGLHFGCDKAMTPGTFWKGLIDDVRIYGRVVRP